MLIYPVSVLFSSLGKKGTHSGRVYSGNTFFSYTLDMPSSSLALWKKPFSISAADSPCLANSMGLMISHCSAVLQTFASGISSKLL